MLTKSVLKKMAHDAISVVAQSDDTILKVGEQLLEKRGTEKAGEVSQKMRLLGRVLQVGRNVTSSELSLEELLKPGHFDTLIESARNISGFEEKTGHLQASLSRPLGLLFTAGTSSKEQQ